jgi:hypothetical protein
MVRLPLAEAARNPAAIATKVKPESVGKETLRLKRTPKDASQSLENAEFNDIAN